jgi:hypothetical protein
VAEEGGHVLIAVKGVAAIDVGDGIHSHATVPLRKDDAHAATQGVDEDGGAVFRRRAAVHEHSSDLEPLRVLR